jgi:hypothetical protein
MTEPHLSKLCSRPAFVQTPSDLLLPDCLQSEAQGIEGANLKRRELVMEVNIALKSWKVLEAEGMRNICGEFVVKAGATEISTQQFNEGYGNQTKVIFSTKLTAEAEALTEKIAQELTDNFTGKKGN